MKKIHVNSFEDLNKYILGLSVVLIGIFVIYFYLVTQSWTELPFSTCTEIAQDEYGDVLVPLGLEGMTLLYSPDNGFNTCRTNISTLVGPIVSLLAGVVVLGIELFRVKSDE